MVNKIKVNQLSIQLQFNLPLNATMAFFDQTHYLCYI